MEPKAQEQPLLEAEAQTVSAEEVIDATISPEPIQLSGFEYAGVRYHLKNPIVVSVEYTDGFWVYRNEFLNLWGYAENREDALRDLHANFAYLCKELGEENDAVLDDKAKSIKQRLRELITTDTIISGN